jgi:hypothetical protein
MNTLREALQEYLALRRSLGFKMQDASRVLPRELWRKVGDGMNR